MKINLSSLLTTSSQILNPDDFIYLSMGKGRWQLSGIQDQTDDGSDLKKKKNESPNSERKVLKGVFLENY